MNGLFRGVIEAVEEAVLNSLATAQAMTGRDGHLADALPLERVLEMLRSDP
jgi:D-aminopeptidase